MDGLLERVDRAITHFLPHVQNEMQLPIDLTGLPVIVYNGRFLRMRHLISRARRGANMRQLVRDGIVLGSYMSGKEPLLSFYPYKVNLNHQSTLEAVLAHELVHHAQYSNFPHLDTYEEHLLEKDTAANREDRRLLLKLIEGDARYTEEKVLLPTKLSRYEISKRAKIDLGILKHFWPEEIEKIRDQYLSGAMFVRDFISVHGRAGLNELYASCLQKIAYEVEKWERVH